MTRKAVGVALLHRQPPAQGWGLFFCLEPRSPQVRRQFPLRPRREVELHFPLLGEADIVPLVAEAAAMLHAQYVENGPSPRPNANGPAERLGHELLGEAGRKRLGGALKVEQRCRRIRSQRGESPAISSSGSPSDASVSTS